MKTKILIKILFILASFAGWMAQGQSWTNSIPGSSDGGLPGPYMALDRSGNAYVTGNVTNNDTSLGYMTVKYSSNGLPIWTNYFRGPGYSGVSCRGIALDANASVYVTGGAADISNNVHTATVAYSSAGVPLWTNWYQSAAVGGDNGVAIAAGSNGVVYVEADDGDFVTIAYSSNGAALWTNRFGGPINGNNFPCAVTAAANSNVYVTGTTVGADSNFEFATIAYSSAGASLWTNYYAGSPSSDQSVRALATDGANNVYVTGLYATVAYSAGGTPLWTNDYLLIEGYGGWASALAVDMKSNCYVTGSVIDTQGLWDYATVKYSASGIPLWTNFCAGTATFGNMANAIALDGSGDVYVTGESGTFDEGNDFLTVAYSTDGVALWTNRFNGIGSQNDIPSAIALNGAGDVYVSGESDGGGFFAMTTIKFSVPAALAPGKSSSAFTSGHFGFDEYGRIGSSVVIQASPDLQSWLPVATNILGSNVVHFVDPQPAGAGNRFYRGVFSPGQN